MEGALQLLEVGSRRRSCAQWRAPWAYPYVATANVRSMRERERPSCRFLCFSNSACRRLRRARYLTPLTVSLRLTRPLRVSLLETAPVSKGSAPGSVVVRALRCASPPPGAHRLASFAHPLRGRQVTQHTHTVAHTHSPRRAERACGLHGLNWREICACDRCG